MIEELFKNKPDSIHDIIPTEFFTRYDNYDYVWSKNCFEWYYAISKTIKPKTFMEIGVRFGFSFLPTLIGTDTLEYALGWDLETYGNNEIAKNNIGKYYTGDCKWEILHVDSQEKKELPQFFDLISIDGCHDYDCKIHDLKMAMYKSRYVIIDDYDYHSNVRRAVNDFMRDYSTKIEWALYIPTFRGSQLIKFKEQKEDINIKKYYPIGTSFEKASEILKSEWKRDFKYRLDLYEKGKLKSIAGVSTTNNSIKPITDELQNIFSEYGVRIILDAPCGDNFIMKDFNFDNIKYIGVDVVDDQIEMNKKNFPNLEFRTLNVVNDKLPFADLVFSRDFLIHLSNLNIEKFINNCISSGCRYLMASTYTKVEENKELEGVFDYRFINLEKEPFNFLKPLKIIQENDIEGTESLGKSMGIWRLVDIKTNI